MEIVLKSIAFVRNSRQTPIDDHWNEIVSEIHLADDIPSEVLLSIGDFSHLEILFHFDQVPADTIVYSGHPRGNPAYPLTGIFAQRKKDRPNRLGLCTVELVEVKDRCLIVRRLDAIDGTPILDIKPVFKEFLPQGTIRQPEWSADLMKAYW
ncbi:MAG TPA: SAM-dependent methyltransferase [Flavisolibacter sp.]|jgi:tRNA-Thr(GGU) m(6)t(6)A37 methyltransferase TsaA|nr:SAM-dependent methyltransferase [Flavisolibacter sp.]